jgi:hypothetical protein
MGSAKPRFERRRIEGLVIVLVAVGYLWEAHRVPPYLKIPGVPGPTTFPWLLGVVFGLAGLWLLLAPRRRAAEPDASGAPQDDPEPFWKSLAERWEFFAIWAVILGYLFAMPQLGFPATTALLLGAFFWLLGERRWWVVVVLALLATGLIYACFGLGLHVRLPLGILG